MIVKAGMARHGRRNEKKAGHEIQVKSGELNRAKKRNV